MQKRRDWHDQAVNQTCVRMLLLITIVYAKTSGLILYKRLIYGALYGNASAVNEQNCATLRGIQKW